MAQPKTNNKQTPSGGREFYENRVIELIDLAFQHLSPDEKNIVIRERDNNIYRGRSLEELNNLTIDEAYTIKADYLFLVAKYIKNLQLKNTLLDYSKNYRALASDYKKITYKSKAVFGDFVYPDAQPPKYLKQGQPCDDRMIASYLESIYQSLGDEDKQKINDFRKNTIGKMNMRTENEICRINALQLEVVSKFCNDETERVVLEKLAMNYRALANDYDALAKIEASKTENLADHFFVNSYKYQSSANQAQLSK